MRHSKLAVFATIVGIFGSFPVYGLTTTITSKVPSALVTNATFITFEFVSSDPEARFICSLDDADPLVCDSPMTYRGLADGQHKFKVMSVSPTEGTDYLGDMHIWTVDTVPPMTKINANQTGADIWEVELISSEPNSTFLCSLDGAIATPCTSPYKIANVGPGNHYFRAQAVDQASNVDPIGADFTFITSLPPPLSTIITYTNPSVPFTNITGIEIGFEANQPASSFMCTLANQTVNCSSPFTAAQLPDGFYTFKVQAIDGYGTVDPIGASYSWTVDTVPPVGAMNLLDSTSTIITVTWTTNEPATTELHWGLEPDLSRLGPGDARFTTTHTVRLTGLSSNSLYAVQPGGVDRAGNPFKMPRLTIRTKR